MTRRGAMVSGGGGSFTPNLPSGLTLVYDITGADLGTVNVVNGAGLYYGGDLRKVTDGTAPYNSTVLETPYAEGSLGGGVGVGSLSGPEDQGWKRIYFAQMVWFSSNYSMHTNEEKYFYPLVASPGNPNEGYGNIDFSLVGSQTANGTQFGFKWYGQLSSATQGHITKGQWCKVEMNLVMSTLGNADGVLQIWVDGVQAMNSSTIAYSLEDTAATFLGMRFDSTRGGGNSSFAVPSGGQVRRFDRLALYASTSF